MNVLVMYGVLVVAPAVVVWVLIKALGWWTRWGGPRRNPPSPEATASSLPRLVNDLHRLEHEYLRVERSDLPARGARLRALNLAYDDTLRACCHELGLPEPCERPLSGVVRLQTEAELAQHGLVW